MNKSKFVWQFLTFWALTYVVTYLRYGAALGAFSLAMRSGGGLNANALGMLGIIFTLLNLALFIGMAMSARAWGGMIGMSWLVSLPIISGVFDEIIPVPVLPTILCLATFLIGVISDVPSSVNQSNASIHGSGNLNKHYVSKRNFIETNDPHSSQAPTTLNSRASEKLIFPTDRMNLSDDGYQIFLVEKYKVVRNDVFQKYVYEEKLYENLNDLLKDLDQLERSPHRDEFAKDQKIETQVRIDKPRTVIGDSENRDLIGDLNYSYTSYKPNPYVRNEKKGRKYFGLLIVIIVVILMAISGVRLKETYLPEFKYEATSSAVEFSGAKLGGKVKDYMHGPSLDVDGGPYFFTKNKAGISYELDDNVDRWKHGAEGKITFIQFECSDEGLFPKSIGRASIDGISCNSSVRNLEGGGWSKLCNKYHFYSYETPLSLIFLKNNAYVVINFDSNKTPLISYFGLYLRKGAFKNGYANCDEVEKMKNKAKNYGYKSLGDMLAGAAVGD